MRKILVIILTIVYLAFTAGVSLQRHYCMNRMTALRFSNHPEERYGFCGMEKTEKDNSCCRDEAAVYKITDDQQSKQNCQLKDITGLPLLQDYTLLDDDVLPLVDTNNLTHAHGPPGLQRVALFIRFSVFRI